jgi:hypothetical protein
MYYKMQKGIQKIFTDEFSSENEEKKYYKD